MNKQYFKLIMLDCQKELEVIFDSRLSFKENFVILSEIEKEYDFCKYRVFDFDSLSLLDDKIPIKSFSFDILARLYLL